MLKMSKNHHESIMIRTISTILSALEVYSSSLGLALVNCMPATCWEVLVRAGFEAKLGSHFRGSASGVSSEQTQPTTR